MFNRSVPATLISGFLGAGKTAVVDHLRRSLKARRAVFLHDSGENELFTEVEEAIQMQGADLIVIECTCHMEPYFAAEALTDGVDDEETVEPPPKGLRVDTLVTVVNAEEFLADILGARDLVEIIKDCEPGDDRTVSEILVEQVEFSDVIILNKIDLVEAKALARAEALLERLNPRAKILRSVKGEVDPVEIVGTGLFDMEETDDGAGWLTELNGGFDGIGVVEGVSSFTYIERRPFHPTRFNELLGSFDIEGLVRVKGSIWVASRHHEIGVWSLAGRASTLSYGGAWFAATPTRDWPEDERERAEIMMEWVPPFGDRRQEIAFIGIDMDEQAIRARLDNCILKSEEMKDAPDTWFLLEDPMPDWHV
jgi:G3E family GTPase